MIGGCAIGAAAALCGSSSAARSVDRGNRNRRPRVPRLSWRRRARTLGRVGTAAAAMVLRRLTGVDERDPIAEDVDAFWRATAFVANAFVFLLTGLSAPSDRVRAAARCAHDRRCLALARVAGAARDSAPQLAGRGAARRRCAAVSSLASRFTRQFSAARPNRRRRLRPVFFTLIVQGLAPEPIARRLKLE